MVGLFGYSADATVGQVFLVGAGAGALALLGLAMIIGGMGRRARRGVAARREARRQEQELRDSQRRDETEVAESAKDEKISARQERIAARQERRAAAEEEERAAQHRAAERDDELASR